MTSKSKVAKILNDAKVPAFDYVVSEEFKRAFKTEAGDNRAMADDWKSFLKALRPEHPNKGKDVQGTGAAKNTMRKGPNGTYYRVIFYFDKENNVVHFLFIYPRKEQEELSPIEAAITKEAVDQIKASLENNQDSESTDLPIE